MSKKKVNDNKNTAMYRPPKVRSRLEVGIFMSKKCVADKKFYYAIKSLTFGKLHPFPTVSFIIYIIPRF